MKALLTSTFKQSTTPHFPQSCLFRYYSFTGQEMYLSCLSPHFQVMKTQVQILPFPRCLGKAPEDRGALFSCICIALKRRGVNVNYCL